MWCLNLRGISLFYLRLHSLGGAFSCFKENILYCFPFSAILQTNMSSQKKMQKQPLIKEDTTPFLHLQKPCQEIVAAFYTRVLGNKNKSLVLSKCKSKNLIKAFSINHQEIWWLKIIRDTNTCNSSLPTVFWRKTQPRFQRSCHYCCSENRQEVCSFISQH